MNETVFERLIKNDCYQVFLFVCPANMPFSFATHPWFVINKKGRISRWEVLFPEAKNGAHWGYLTKDFYDPVHSIGIIPYVDTFFWGDGKLLGSIEGSDASPAHQMAEAIESSPRLYPFCNKYSIFGPNSNTYVQWALNQFPNSGIELPWNAFGKDFKYE